jgi:Acetyltransferase (GNAT) family
MIQCQVEQWSSALPELLPLFSMLWDDVAVDKDKFVAECDQQKYFELEKIGMLHLVTARSEGELVGFFLVFLTPNAHYKNAGLMAFTDMYYLKPEHRKGNAGLKLFSFMERTLKDKGVVKAYTSHKLHRDRSAMFEFLGWKATDVVYSKVIQ